MKLVGNQLRYFLFWIIYFIVARGIFLLYHQDLSSTLSGSEILKVFIYGLRLDASFTAYLCIFPFLCLVLNNLFKNFPARKIIAIYTYTLLAIISFLVITDLELYTAWGFRLDATPLRYFNQPREMTASIAAAPILGLLLIYVLLFLTFIWLYKFLRPKLYNLIHRFSPVLLSLILLIILFIPIRGGLQQIPINQSDVYFSEKTFANHAAINVPWNLMHSLLNKNISGKNPYTYLPESQARQLVDSLYQTSNSVIPNILTTKRPNIIFIILESYTSKFIGCLGGEPGVTPNIDSIARDGMLFTNIYASGDRSEKGLVALLSGYPTQTTTSVIFDPAKTEKLPHLQDYLRKLGYHSSYYYGGELEFANIKSYVLNSGYQTLVTKHDFNAADYNSKWGVHDHVLLNRLQLDLSKQPSPFFITLFTLSSHEPFEIPIAKKFPGTDETSLFKNSFYYTDYAIGNFIRDARKQPWWDSTLIVMVADHGHRLPGDDPNYVPSKFRIPLILTGGALKNRQVVDSTLGSQADISATLLQQMDIKPDAFKWSKNLLDVKAKPFAFYVFNDGFGFVTPQGTFAFDNVSQKIIYRDKGVTDQQVATGKAYMQMSFQDFLQR